MNRTWIGNLSALLGILLLTAACQPIRPKAAIQASALTEQEQFTKVALGLEEAYQQADLQRTIAFYADNAISQPPGYRTDVGKAAIQASYQAFFETYDFKRDFKLAGVMASGKWFGKSGTPTTLRHSNDWQD